MTAIKFAEVEARIKDRAMDTRATGRDLLAAWGFDLDSRRPGVAYVDEAGMPVTTLDMACLLSELVEWGSVIVVPTYEAHGVATKKAGEVVLSKENRHGKIVGVLGHKDRFNFSVRILDMNVMTSHSVGAWRNFLLMTDGVWHDGFNGLTFVPDHAENERIAKIAQFNNTMTFEHLIDPSRWTSFYGAPYLLAKLLITRLADEKKHLDAEIKRVRTALNITTTSSYEPSEKVGEEKKVTVWSCLVEVDGLALTGAYPAVPTTKEGLEEATNRRTRLNGYLERLRFQTRATEYALWLRLNARYTPDQLVPLCNGTVSPEKIPVAGWVKTAWTTFQASKRHASWLAIDLNGYKLRLRCWQSTATVAA